MKILYVIPSLDYGRAAGQLALLAADLHHRGFTVCVAVIGGDGPMGRHLRQAGVPVEFLGWERLVDPAPVWRLRRLLTAFRPTILHVWKPLALRMVGLLSGWGGAGLVVSRPWPPTRLPSVSLVDRCLLRRARAVIVGSGAEWQLVRRTGVAADRVVIIPPGVAPTSEETPAEALPQGQHVLAVGPLEVRKGFRDAIWALDILRFPHPDLHLSLIGEGPDRPRLEAFAQTTRTHQYVHFLGRQARLGSWLRRADIVWVPSLGPTGVQTALEAMAAGRPVVASRWPELAELMTDGETGFLVPPGDKAMLARRTHRLLREPQLARQVGESARQRARDCFPAAKMTAAHGELYLKIAA
ncbi:MAG: glycosyltransferase [Gemmataceae bacterium]|nr:glycosyltransferase [Gemmataceae bacterium]MDW8264865.1 glycosyltransferase [Gemmataceae bacterium]